MENKYIWTESALERIIAAGNSQSAEWAISTLFSIYPEAAAAQLPSLLSDNREAVVRAALRDLPEARVEDAVPALKKLYLEGSPEIAALAMRAIGKWKGPEAVAWVEERILAPERVAPEVGAATIAAMGEIPTEEAFSFLRRTEEAVKPKEGSYLNKILRQAMLLHEARKNSAESTIEPIANWREELERLLASLSVGEGDRARVKEIMRDAPREGLVAALAAHIEGNGAGRGAALAVEMLGSLRAVETVPAIIRVLGETKDDEVFYAAEKALLGMGPTVAGGLFPLLDERSPMLQTFALTTLAQMPTVEVVAALVSRFPKLLEDCQPGLFTAIGMIAAEDFLPLLEAAYQPGEWDIGGVYAHIARINGVSAPRLEEIEKDVKRGVELRELRRKLMDGDFSRWPREVELRLKCQACGKAYHYLVNGVHVHPVDRSGEVKQPEGHPYHSGVVVCDDIRCKGCGALNAIDLTPEASERIAAEMLMLLALRKAGAPFPTDYPVKQVRTGEKDGKPLTLVEIENDRLTAVRKDPTKAERHLALAKFYEYVKLYPKARATYLRALDMEPGALEAMAGLARIFHAEGELQQAYDWVEGCHQKLGTGRIYFSNFQELKKAVQEKRREYARELGVRVRDDYPVDIRFRMDDPPEHPKNQPCPCGSGKKYKLCCMKKS
ncbi:MAG: SEC-C metal-binding domain-containing protein [Syntrophobacteraceae bacterium]